MPQLDFYSFQEQYVLIIPFFIFFYFFVTKIIIPNFFQIIKIREVLSKTFWTNSNYTNSKTNIKNKLF